MKALSLWPGYALEVLSGEKTIEYRTWRTHHRGDLLICATAKKVSGTIPGHALVVVNLVDVIKKGDRDFEWIFTDPRPIYPLPVKGQQGLFNVDDSKIKYIPDEILYGDIDDYNVFWYTVFEPLILE